jgi:hypothetical protein
VRAVHVATVGIRTHRGALLVETRQAPAAVGRHPEVVAVREELGERVRVWILASLLITKVTF